MAIVATIVPIEFSAKVERQIDNEETVSNDKKATAKPAPYLQRMSFSGNITIPSLFKTIKSPLPKIRCDNPNASRPSHNVKNKVYNAPAINFDSTI